ncbi:hypothetical protein KAFR_0F00410 [Kazachstania africana CBS 2517]|uniref:Uncharacterized protein n=1 Tax=Kazachstania africana (strain ATCC 22294 / BCRC 22015 / CBS 2517 / CECT 1963 / NBRC 1671 / NRRL Y-8276) TaxID=1071382 RepID=H2AW88_KAZAF|nr:hypothetical protein KAFR_0F00410 [Kazachstania africana CBS 2517]CCF58638.1 hypothetical protein KAFR_0F00410 [Kazachstania africana CBS 2517]
MFDYKAICTVSTGLILVSTSFIMGVFYNNLAYDYELLFNPAVTQEAFDNSLKHYQLLNDVGRPLLYILGFVTFLGLIGNIARVYKPNPELQIFEYCSLGLFVLGICIFITNIKTGIECSITHSWGEVTENQGLAVIGSSNIILLIVFLGVLVLQAGLWYSNYDYENRLKAFYAAESAKAPATKSTPAKEKKQKKEAKKTK